VQVIDSYGDSIGMAAHRLCPQLVAKGGHWRYRLLVFTDESRAPYERVKLRFDDTDGLREHENISLLDEARHIQPYQRIMVVMRDTPSMHVTVRHAIRLAALVKAEVDFLAVPIIQIDRSDVCPHPLFICKD
jgi:glycine/D-amino acid oxidase-like deaminating enzyme